MYFFLIDGNNDIKEPKKIMTKYAIKDYIIHNQCVDVLRNDKSISHKPNAFVSKKWSPLMVEAI